MGRPKKTDEDKLIEQMQALGIDPQLVKQALQKPVDSEEDLILEAESVLIYYDTEGEGFTRQICPECGKEFAYKYRIEYPKGMKCSNECRVKALEKIHIKWDPNKSPEQRWAMGGQTKGDMPLRISPNALKILDQIIPPKDNH